MGFNGLSNEVIPEIDFIVSSTGLTIYCSRLNTPRFVPFDLKGKCGLCKSDSAELDFLVSRDGITLYCSRIKKEKFISFDLVYDLPQKCYFRVKTKGKIFNVPYESLREEKANNSEQSSTVEMSDIIKEAMIVADIGVDVSTQTELPESSIQPTKLVEESSNNSNST